MIVRMEGIGETVQAIKLSFSASLLSRFGSFFSYMHAIQKNGRAPKYN